MLDLIKAPIIKDWMKPEDKLFRERANDYFQRAQDLGMLPKTVKDWGIFRDGETSVVYLANPESDPFVVKMALGEKKLLAEAEFLKAWNEKGVKTPEIYAAFPATDMLPVSMVVMEYIREKSIHRLIENGGKISPRLVYDLGHTLAIMHLCEGEGFGEASGKRGKYETQAEDLNNRILGRKLDYLRENGLISSEEGSALTVASSILAAGSVSRVTHNDYGLYNLMATEPFTVTDPDPKLGDPLLDLGNCLNIWEAGYGESMGSTNEIIQGYSQVSKIDGKRLAAARAIQASAKIRTWSSKGRTEKVHRIHEIMSRELGKMEG
ncbi:MAG: aminoglycoside phosphotransferase family protein [Candidatus Shapirobacteria bacterium]